MSVYVLLTTVLFTLNRYLVFNRIRNFALLELMKNSENVYD